MKKRKITMAVLAMTLMLATSCKKKGCTDYNATNYSTEAGKDDGSCSYPTKAKIQFIVLKSFPTVDDSGNNWDLTDLADPYIQIQDDYGNILYQTSVYDNFAPPITWEISPKITIDGFSTPIWLYLYDEDGVSDDFIGLTSIYLDNYTQSGIETEKYPFSIESTFGGCTFEISGISWE